MTRDQWWGVLFLLGIAALTFIMVQIGIKIANRKS
jgi:hypothetical protein